MRAQSQSFGLMSASVLFSSGLPATRGNREIVSSFLRVSEGYADRWYDTRKGIMLLVHPPYEPASGAIYIYHRRRDLWYMVHFEDVIDTMFTVEAFEYACKEYKLADYVGNPELLLTLVRAAGKRTESAPDDCAEVIQQVEELRGSGEAPLPEAA